MPAGAPILKSQFKSTPFSGLRRPPLAISCLLAAVLDPKVRIANAQKSIHAFQKKTPVQADNFSHDSEKALIS